MGKVALAPKKSIPSAMRWNTVRKEWKPVQLWESTVARSLILVSHGQPFSEQDFFLLLHLKYFHPSFPHRTPHLHEMRIIHHRER